MKKICILTVVAALAAPLGSAFAGVSLEQDVTPYMWEIRAETYMELGDYARAVDYGRRMVAAIPQQWNLERAQRIHALGVLGLSLAFAGDRAAAQERARELEAVSTSYPYVLLKTDKQVFLARLYVALGNYQRAYEIVKEDDNSFFRGLADAVSGGATLEGGSLLAFQQIQRRFMRHKSELETGRLAEAKAGYDEMLGSPATQENGDFYWIVLYDRGRIAEREGNAAEAANFYKRAVEVIERQRSTLNTEASKIGFIGSKQSVYQDLVRVLVAQGRGVEAFEYVERSKARALVDMLAAKQDFAVATGNAQEVMALLAASAAAEAEGRVPEGGDKARQTRSLVARTQAQLAVQAPELASLVAVTTLATAEIQQRLGPAEALVEYYYGTGRELYAFVLTRDALGVHALDGTNLADEIRLFRQAINKPGSEDWRAPAQRLHERLMKPLEAALVGSQLTIVAHGGLHYLPFNALFDGRQFLVERYGACCRRPVSSSSSVRAAATSRASCWRSAIPISASPSSTCRSRSRKRKPSPPACRARACCCARRPARRPSSAMRPGSASSTSRVTVSSIRTRPCSRPCCWPPTARATAA
jgi:tetratricopeptide (TPR) repeat protein